MSYSSSKEIHFFYFDLFRFTLFTRLFILYASLRNNVYGMFLYVGQCKCAFIERVKASKMHLYVVFSEVVLGISAGHLCNKTVEREEKEN